MPFYNQRWLNIACLNTQLNHNFPIVKFKKKCFLCSLTVMYTCHVRNNPIYIYTFIFSEIDTTITSELDAMSHFFSLLLISTKKTLL